VAIASVAVHDIRILVAEHQDQLVINIDRSAAQVLNCHGHVAAHLPVTREIITGLTSVTTESP
jgi:hypothetical protein